MNYYRRYIGDYQSDTPHLSIVEHGAYNLLLDFIYGTEKPLPKDKQAIYRICRAFDPVEQAAIDGVLSQYFHLTDDGYVNNKALEIIAHDRVRIDAARANGKLGGRPKAKPSGIPSGIGNDNPTPNLDESSPAPAPALSLKPLKPKSTSAKANDVLSIFTYWQTVMNHKRAKLDDDRKRRIRNALKSGYSVDDLKSAIDGCSATPHNMGQNDRCQRFDGLSIILKNAESVDRFMSNNKGIQHDYFKDCLNNE